MTAATASSTLRSYHSADSACQARKRAAWEWAAMFLGWLVPWVFGGAFFWMVGAMMTWWNFW